MALSGCRLGRTRAAAYDPLLILPSATAVTTGGDKWSIPRPDWDG